MSDTEKCLTDLEDTVMEFVKSEHQKEKFFKNESSLLRDLWNNTKCINIHPWGCKQTVKDWAHRHRYIVIHILGVP